MAKLLQERQKSHYPIKDPLDRVTSMTSPAGTTQYHYDTVTGRLDKITSPEGKQFTYAYNHGQLESLTYPNNIKASYAFNDNGNLTSLVYENASTHQPINAYTYSYDKNGMRTSMTDNDGVHDYTYDTLYQIIQATNPSIPNPLEQFSYDAVGNRLTDLTHTNYQYNELNQLTEDDSCLYAYDLDGNMTEKIDKATGDTTHFVYDIENKLVEVRKPGMLAKYTYDALGRRMSKEVNGEVKQFRYDGQDLILEMYGSDSIIANYTFGVTIDDPLSMNRAGKNYYYLKDALGSIGALTDSIGDVALGYRYSAYGEITEQLGDSTILNPFTYTSREYDAETDNYYYRARYFDPKSGRFLSEDPPKLNPLGCGRHDLNLYRYVRNNPSNLGDPSGKDPFDPDATSVKTGDKSMMGCINRVVSQRSKFPPKTNDKYKHCVVSCYISDECGHFAAALAGIGKEVKDMFGPGNAEWADWKADVSGMDCSKNKQKGGDECPGGKENNSCESCCKKSHAP